MDQLGTKMGLYYIGSLLSPLVLKIQWILPVPKAFLHTFSESFKSTHTLSDEEDKIRGKFEVL